MVQRSVLIGRDVRLEPLELAHVDALVRAAAEDRATYTFTSVPAGAEEMRAYVAAALEDQQEDLSLPFVICDREGRVVGSTRFLDLEFWTTPPPWPGSRLRAGTANESTPTVAEIGATWLAASAQRTCINTEAKLLMLTHAFDAWRVERVTFKTDARNQRSRDAIARIGAQFEGIRRAHCLATDGTIRDSAYFSIVTSEWPAVKEALAAKLRRVPES